MYKEKTANITLPKKPQSRDIILEEIGDAFLESVVNVDVQDNVNIAEHLIAYRRDYAIIDVKTNCNKIYRYEVYASSYGSDTRVLNVIRKTDLYLPIIMYYETNDVPSTIVDSVYFYQTGTNRSVNLRKAKNIVTVPEQETLLNLNLLNQPNPTLIFDIGTLKLNVPQELLDLAVIIKKGEYISSASYDELITAVNYLIIF